MKTRNLITKLTACICAICFVGCSRVNADADTNPTARSEEPNAITNSIEGTTVDINTDTVSNLTVYYYGHYSECNHTKVDPSNFSDYQITKDGHFRFTNWYDACNEKENGVIESTITEKKAEEIFSILSNCTFYEYDPYHKDPDGSFVNAFYPNVISIDGTCYQLPKSDFITLLDAVDAIKCASH